jgi:hypothetical protein
LAIGPAEMIDHDLDAGGFQRRQDLWQVLAVDMGMHMPVEIGEAAEQRAIVEGGMSGSLGQSDEGQPMPTNRRGSSPPEQSVPPGC